MNLPGLTIHHSGFMYSPRIEDVKLKAYGRQKKKSWEDGHYIRSKAKRPLTADYLEMLLDNPDRIPKAWEGKLVCFYGTVYKAASPGAVHENQIVLPTLYIRFLVKAGGAWHSELMSLDDEFGPTRLSAEEASEWFIMKLIRKILR